MAKDNISMEQGLMYTGAALAAAGCVVGAVNNGQGVEKIYSKCAPCAKDTVGRKMIQWQALSDAAFAAMQGVAAYEKPSKRMLAATGTAYVASGVMVGIHTYSHKACNTDTGLALTAVNVALGGAMIGRAIWMHRNKDKKADDKAVKK